MVMPRSRSRSLLSITRSSTRWFSRHAGGAEDRIDQGGLAVIDVRDDGYVADALRDVGRFWGVMKTVGLLSGF